MHSVNAFAAKCQRDLASQQHGGARAHARPAPSRAPHRTFLSPESGTAARSGRLRADHTSAGTSTSTLKPPHRTRARRAVRRAGRAARSSARARAPRARAQAAGKYPSCVPTTIVRRALEPLCLACLHTCCQTSALSMTLRRWLNVVTLRGNARGLFPLRTVLSRSDGPRTGSAARPAGMRRGDRGQWRRGSPRGRRGRSTLALRAVWRAMQPMKGGGGRRAFSRRSDARGRARRRFDGSNQRPKRGCDRRNSHPPALFFVGASFGFSDEPFRLFGV